MFKFGRVVLDEEFLSMNRHFQNVCITSRTVMGAVIADFNYDFNMNKFKNRLETFKDWPFTEETGSSCTARKVRQICRFSDFETSVFKSEVCFRTSSVHVS